MIKTNNQGDVEKGPTRVLKMNPSMVSVASSSDGPVVGLELGFDCSQDAGCQEVPAPKHATMTMALEMIAACTPRTT